MQIILMDRVIVAALALPTLLEDLSSSYHWDRLHVRSSRNQE